MNRVLNFVAAALLALVGVLFASLGAFLALAAVQSPSTLPLAVPCTLGCVLAVVGAFAAAVDVATAA